jgi:hypothetical protein
MDVSRESAIFDAEKYLPERIRLLIFEILKSNGSEIFMKSL